MSNLNNQNFKSIINTVIEMIKDNESTLLKIKKVDDEVFNFEVYMDKLIEIFEQNKNREIKEECGKNILVNHYGNPYVTALICIEALVNQCGVVIGIEDACYGINKVLIKIINEALKEYRVDLQFILKNNISNHDAEKMDLDKIVCLGNSNSYMQFRKMQNVQVEDMPLFSVALYYDSDEFEEVVETIRYYAERNFYEIEIFDETEEFEDVIYMINHGGNTYCSVILSKDFGKQNEFRQKVHSEIVCVNENPFRKFELNIEGKIF